MSDPLCKCSMAISVLGYGCRHCQPQEYIDNMTQWLVEEREELAKAEQKITELQRENAELKRIMECKPVGEVEYEYAGKLRIDQRVKWADGALGNLKSGDKLYTSPPIQDGMATATQ